MYRLPAGKARRGIEGTNRPPHNPKGKQPTIVRPQLLRNAASCRPKKTAGSLGVHGQTKVKFAPGKQLPDALLLPRKKSEYVV
jgi:hypothetical protein